MASAVIVGGGPNNKLQENDDMYGYEVERQVEDPSNDFEKEQERLAEEQRQREANEAEWQRRREQTEVKRRERAQKAEAEAEQMRKEREEEEKRQMKVAEKKDKLWKKEQDISLEVTKKIDRFLHQNGYGNDVNGKRTVLMRYYHPLHDAVWLGDAELVQGLLLFGADPTLRSSSGKTPLQAARKWNNAKGSLNRICAILEAAEPQ